MGSIIDNDIHNSRIDNSSFNGGSLHGPDIYSPDIMHGMCYDVLLENCLINIPCFGPEQISNIIDNYNEQISLLKQQNEFLLKLLVNKGVLENEKEVQELIDAHNLANKLSEEDKNGAK